MGQKIIPISLRLNKNKNWHSQWVVEKKNYAEILHFDLEVRKYLETLLNKEDIKVLKINVNKISKNMYIYVYIYNNPFIKYILKDKIKIVSHLNSYLEQKYNIKLFILKTHFNLVPYQKNLSLIFKYLKKKHKVKFKFKKILDICSLALATGKVNMISKLIQQNLENKKIHKGYLRFINKILTDFFKIHSKLLGYRLQIKGRINGAKRKRKLVFQQGKIPLNTLKNNIQYTFDEFKTKSGICSIKMWFYLKDFENKKLIINKKKNGTFAPISKFSSFKKKKKKSTKPYDSALFKELFYGNKSNDNSKKKK